MRWTPRSLANPQPAADQPGRLAGLLLLLRQRFLRYRLSPHAGSDNDPLAEDAGTIDTAADETDDEAFNERDSVACEFVTNEEAEAPRSREPNANLSEGVERSIGGETWPLAAAVGEPPWSEDDELRLEARFATRLNRHCLVEQRRACSRRREVADGRARSAPPQRVCRRGR